MNLAAAGATTSPRLPNIFGNSPSKWLVVVFHCRLLTKTKFGNEWEAAIFAV